jgi:hypothetical protein
MMEATEEHFAHDDVTVLQLDAPESRRWAHDGLIKFVHALDRLAAMHEKRLMVRSSESYLGWLPRARRPVGLV